MSLGELPKSMTPKGREYLFFVECTLKPLPNLIIDVVFKQFVRDGTYTSF